VDSFLFSANRRRAIVTRAPRSLSVESQERFSGDTGDRVTWLKQMELHTSSHFHPQACERSVTSKK
jgi:hypothetical protein